MPLRLALSLLAAAFASVAFGARAPGVTRAFERQRASPPLTLEQARRAAARGRRLEAPAEDDPVEQVHIMPGLSGAVTVVFLSRERGVPSRVLFGSAGRLDRSAEGRVRTYTTLQCPEGDYLTSPPMGAPPMALQDLADVVNTSAFSPEDSAQYLRLNSASEAWGALSEGCVDYKNPRGYWVSKYIHSVTLPDLEPDTEYTYRPAAGMREFTFTTPPSPGHQRGPLRIGLMADIGSTNVSKATMDALLGQDLDLLFVAGDYSYADGWAELWDTFGILAEPLMSSVPHAGVPGNHEISSGRYQGRDWEMRYPMPFASDSPWWYSYEAGLVHVVGLAGSYSPTGPGSPQHEFLKEDLEAVDRTRTPWVVVLFHTPWYNSNSYHYLEGFNAQQDLEATLYQHGVDLVVNGHVHSYERSHPVYNSTVEPCGITHIVVGDAGNYEGPSTGGWRQPQPTWSAFREASFGAGVLVVENSTHASWQWRRAACATESGTRAGGDPHFTWTGPAPHGNCTTAGDNSAQAYEASDEVLLVRDAHACPNRAGSRRLRVAAPGLVI
mmetsp:Transcript_4926/g.13954  ORF Transcript_4926/g.13954 Transcript_4926/m.13954 type:complete len:553 (-) Transcript_4926:175-1833(-)